MSPLLSSTRPRVAPARRSPARRASYSVDVVLLTVQDGQLAEVLVHSPAWMEQIGAFGDGRRHPGGGDISVAYVGLVPAGTMLPGDGEAEFFPVTELPAISPRQRMMVDSAVAPVRARRG